MAGIADLLRGLLGQPSTPPSVNFSSDALGGAVTEAKRRYPRFANLPLSLTYNPQRDWNSETYPPEEEGNPKPGQWDVDMGRAPYAQQPKTWPELVGLEAIHGLQDTDPTYQRLVDAVIQSYTPEQMARARRAFQRDRTNGSVSNDFGHYLRWVDAQEVIRGRLWGKLFRDTEQPYRKNEQGDVGANNPWEGYTPQQINLLDTIQAYLQSKK